MTRIASLFELESDFRRSAVTHVDRRTSLAE